MNETYTKLEYCEIATLRENISELLTTYHICQTLPLGIFSLYTVNFTFTCHNMKSDTQQNSLQILTPS